MSLNDFFFWLLVGLMLLGSLLIVGLAFFYRHPVDRLTAYERWRTQRRVQQAEPQALGADSDLEVYDEADEVLTPLPVDPTNLPTPKNYVHTEGKPRRQCYCHQREIPDGFVLWWPMPNSPEVRLFCPEGVAAMKAAH